MLRYLIEGSSKSLKTSALKTYEAGQILLALLIRGALPSKCSLSLADDSDLVLINTGRI